MDNDEIRGRIRGLLGHEVSTANDRADLPHAAIADLSAALASMGGVVEPGPLENTVTGVEPELADPMRTACLAVDAVISVWRAESRGFRDWWVNLGPGRGNTREMAAEAVRDVLAQEVDRSVKGSEPVGTVPTEDPVHSGESHAVLSSVGVDALRDGRPEAAVAAVDILTARVRQLEGTLRATNGQRDRMRERAREDEAEHAGVVRRLMQENAGHRDANDVLRANLADAGAGKLAATQELEALRAGLASLPESRRLVPRRDVASESDWSRTVHGGGIVWTKAFAIPEEDVRVDVPVVKFRADGSLEWHTGPVTFADLAEILAQHAALGE